jgi:hypothetical protein
MLRAVIYARFSSDKQRDRSIQDQVALCRGFCERDGFDVVVVEALDRLMSLATIGRQVSPLYTPEDFLDSRVGTLPAINNPRTAALTVQPGHRDQLPSNYGVARRVEPEAKFFNDFSRARACACAQGSVGSDSAITNELPVSRQTWRAVATWRQRGASIALDSGLLAIHSPC